MIGLKKYVEMHDTGKSVGEVQYFQLKYTYKFSPSEGKLIEKNLNVSLTRMTDLDGERQYL